MTMMSGHNVISHWRKIITGMPSRKPADKETPCLRPSAGWARCNSHGTYPCHVAATPGETPYLGRPDTFFGHIARRAVRRMPPHTPALPEDFSGVDQETGRHHRSKFRLSRYLERSGLCRSFPNHETSSQPFMCGGKGRS